MDTSPVPHTRLCDEQGRIGLEVDDIELADWLDDQLTEVFALHVDAIQQIGSQTRFWFRLGQDVDEVLAALRQVDPGEAERIFLINDKTRSASDVLQDFADLPLHDASVHTMDLDWKAGVFRINLSVFFDRTQDAKHSELIFWAVTGLEIPREAPWGHSIYVNSALFEPPNLYVLQMQSGDVLKIRAGAFQLRATVERRPTSR
jgi:hypothetical protein